MVRFIHTADWQLGKPFHSHPEGEELQRVRLEAIERIAETAEEQDVDFVVVAGDVFDANTVSRRDVVLPACARLEAFSMPVFLLPGNHDHIGSPDSVLLDDRFQSNCPEHVDVLADEEPVPVCDQEALLLPAPLTKRQPLGDTMDHIDADTGSEWPDAIRIAVAHGSVTRFDENIEGEASNHIDPDRAARANLDYVALGDWHGRKRVTDRVWYSGTPEPDRYKDNDPGHVLVVQIDEPGATPSVDPIETRKLRWLALERTFDASEDVDAMASWISDLDATFQTVIKLTIGGVLRGEPHARLMDLLDDLAGRAFELRRRGEISPAVSPDDIDLAALGGYVERAAEQLLAAASGEHEEKESQLDALVEDHAPWHEEVFERDDTARRALRLLQRIAAVEGDA